VKNHVTRYSGGGRGWCGFLLFGYCFKKEVHCSCQSSHWASAKPKAQKPCRR